MQSYDLESVSNSAGAVPGQADLAQARGKSVRWLHVRVTKTQDMDAIAACTQVERLWIWNWQAADFSLLRHLNPREVYLAGGRQLTLDGLNDARLKWVWLVGTGKLEAIGPLRIPRLDLQACNRLRLDTLGEVRNLVCLVMRSMKVIDSLSFVEPCKDLEAIIFAGYAFRAPDLRPLMRSKPLRYIESNKLKGPQVAEIAAGNRRAFVTNRTVAFDCGESVNPDLMHARWTALLREHGLPED